MIKAILTDIEGTTSSVSFVKDVLFPYSYQKLPDFVAQNPKLCAPILDEVRQIEANPHLDTEQCVNVLLHWIETDQKITPLKTLQGMIWAEGYRNGNFRGHVYSDAARWLRRWKASGLHLYVFSSGSVAAQKLIFGYSTEGDLTYLFSGYFDTLIGSKQNPQSYTEICRCIGCSPAQILFLSDSQIEIQAAQYSNLKTILVLRQGISSNAGSDYVCNFDQIGWSVLTF